VGRVELNKGKLGKGWEEQKIKGICIGECQGNSKGEGCTFCKFLIVFYLLRLQRREQAEKIDKNIKYENNKSKESTLDSKSIIRDERRQKEPMV